MLISYKQKSSRSRFSEGVNLLLYRFNLPLEKDMVLLSFIESPSSLDALCHDCLKSTPWFWEEGLCKDTCASNQFIFVLNR